MDAQAWRATLGSRRLELRWERTGRLTSVTRLLVDGASAGESAGRPLQREAVITGAGVRVSLRRGLTSALSEAVARPEGGDASQEVAFAPPPDTPQARLAALARERPGLYASRHVAAAAAKLALGILGIGALIALIPWPDIPAIPFPDVPSPEIPWPDVSLPDVTLPGWIEWILETSNWWAPVLVAIVIAVREARRRRRRAENAERQREAPPGLR
jgi:hypothetical protein